MSISDVQGIVLRASKFVSHPRSQKASKRNIEFIVRWTLIFVVLSVFTICAVAGALAHIRFLPPGMSL